MTTESYRLNSLPYVCILSACRGLDYDEDMANNAALFMILANLKKAGAITAMRSVAGYYQGTREASYLVTFTDPSVIFDMITIGETFKQECILIREFQPNGLPMVNLRYTDNSGRAPMDIGHKFEQIGHQDDLIQAGIMPEACTIMDGMVWVVK